MQSAFLVECHFYSRCFEITHVVIEFIIESTRAYIAMCDSQVFGEVLKGVFSKIIGHDPVPLSTIADIMGLTTNALEDNAISQKFAYTS